MSHNLKKKFCDSQPVRYEESDFHFARRQEISKLPRFSGSNDQRRILMNSPLTELIGDTLWIEK